MLDGFCVAHVEEMWWRGVLGVVLNITGVKKKRRAGSAAKSCSSLIKGLGDAKKKAGSKKTRCVGPQTKNLFSRGAKNAKRKFFPGVRRKVVSRYQQLTLFSQLTIGQEMKKSEVTVDVEGISAELRRIHRRDVGVGCALRVFSRATQTRRLTRGGPRQRGKFF